MILDKNYILNLEKNIDKLKTTNDLLTLNINTKEMEKIILEIRNKYRNTTDLFNKYITKNIFGKIFHFLPARDAITNRNICKNWKELLTDDYIKKVINLSTEPREICYFKSFNNNFKYINKINNNLCGYSYRNEYIKILNEKGGVEKKHSVGKNNSIITGNTDFICYTKNHIIINKPDKKIIKEWKKDCICDMTIDGKYLYILGSEGIYEYDYENENIKYWKIEYGDIYWKLNGAKAFYVKIIVEKGKIYLLRGTNDFIKIYSNGKLVDLIDTNDNCSDHNARFDISGNYIYVINNYLIKILTKDGKEIYNIKHNIRNYDNIFVIYDNIYVITSSSIYVYKIKFN